MDAAGEALGFIVGGSRLAPTVNVCAGGGGGVDWPVQAANNPRVTNMTAQRHPRRAGATADVLETICPPRGEPRPGLRIARKV